MMIFLDTDILIDFIRSYTPSVSWLLSINERVAISGFTAMELIQGCKSNTEKLKVQKVLKRLNTIWLSIDGCNDALESFSNYKLKFNVGFIDCMIAHTALENDVPLYTFNLKHYKPFSKLRTIQPYLK